MIDLRWTIDEGPPATINKIEIVGNDVTHERVIREAIVILPGDVFTQDRLIRSYQNISNLGFFQQPLPSPDVAPAPPNGVRHRPHLQGSGEADRQHQLRRLGGAGDRDRRLPRARGAEPVRPGQEGAPAVAVRAQHQRLHAELHRPGAVRQSRVSGTISPAQHAAAVHHRRPGQPSARAAARSSSGSRCCGARYSRLFAQYSLAADQLFQRVARACRRASSAPTACAPPSASAWPAIRASTAVPDRRARWCTSGLEFNGGLLGGSATTRSSTSRGAGTRPLGSSAAAAQLADRDPAGPGADGQGGLHLRQRRPVLHRALLDGRRAVRHSAARLRRVLDHAARLQPAWPAATTRQAPSVVRQVVRRVHGGVRGAAQPVALRSTSSSTPATCTARPASIDPTRLFRGAGVGAAMISPLGPIGLDLGYGFDKTSIFGVPKPGWKLHFRLGNFF